MSIKCAVVLAAGEGTRMKSKSPKVLCNVAFKPMVRWVYDACKEAGVDKTCLVLGASADEVLAVIPDEVSSVIQKERLGTANAVMAAYDFLRENASGDVLVLCGDAPLIDAKTINLAFEYHKQNQSDVTVISAIIDNPTGYGRIKRNGESISIVEQADCTPEEQQICEINSGVYWFKISSLLSYLPKITPNPKKGEYYLTDVLKIAGEDGDKAFVYKADNINVTLGANDLKGLLALNKIAFANMIEKHLANGVEFISDEGVCISPDVTIGVGTKILPNTILRGNTKIGEGCVLGPNTLIEDSEIADGAVINASQVYKSKVGNAVKIGPFSQIRPDCVIADGVKIGDFVEVKNSNIGEKTSIAHLTYIGDSDIGARGNFGCGVVTVNYDGKNKYRTTVGDDVFVGCNTNLVAPVKVGNGSYIAAGATITKDIGEGDLAIARAKQENKSGWAKRQKMFSKK
ncbi:MAG: bifunctional UDP-N-acetylglucosamine diphosphorylase/glucosamine-1-phosphate N-acetyltransferase GlmU [Oscillospiraceae bacterium]|nr:bifunctional UDP-N-acetylglucosamine diphosphorylase/glucosamine-1-phosphate N-acetyltransferase GlmU [Oscillospiraceae bacterium]